MRLLDDLLGRPPRVEGERPTRFHTQRRALIPPREWISAIRPLIAERTGRIPTEPWLAPAAVRWLQRVVERSWSVLELGAGSSTIWFADKAGTVTSFETDRAWHESLGRELDAGVHRNVELRLVPRAELLRRVRALPEDEYDLVIIDFKEWVGPSRVECVGPARSKVRPGGYLLLDNSDRPRYRAVDELLAGWPVRRFAGMTYGPFAAIETSIWRRPMT